MEQVISHTENSAPDIVSYYPFISLKDTIDYVKCSKLMVLANDHEEKLFLDISRTYGNDSSCISSSDESGLLRQAKVACEAGRHVVALNTSYDNVTQLQAYANVAKEYNYLILLTNESMDLLPTYLGWHLNEADSCMLGLVAHAHLEELLRTVPEFCSDFRNFSDSETIREMLKYYTLASSNYHGMLHCTAKYIGSSPTESSKDYFRDVKHNISQFYETSVIGLVFTPRTFGARVKLSPSQLELWGGDEDGVLVNSNLVFSNGSTSFVSNGGKVVSPSSTEDVNDPVLSVCSDLAKQSISCDNETSFEDGNLSNNAVDQFQPHKKKDSPRHFPHCQASLVCVPSDDEPDFHPVTGRGHRAHMTLGVAAGVSAVTTGTDLLEIVQCESEDRDWPTYEGPRGWLRDYGKGRWVLYMKKHVKVGALFMGVYNFSSSDAS